MVAQISAKGAAAMLSPSGKTVARVGDKFTCPWHGPNVIVEGARSTIDGRPIARVGDKCACGCVIIEGETRALLDGRPMAHIGSKLISGGMIVESMGSASFG